MEPELIEPLSSLTLLVVEDDLATLDLLRIPLMRWHKQVYVARSGKTGLKYFKSHQIDIVLTDVFLKGKLDGITMVKNMRKINPDVPVIFMTAYSDPKKIQEMIKLNAVSLIKKEVDLEELCVLLLSISRNHRTTSKEKSVNLGRGITYYPYEQSITKDSKTIALTDRECKVLNVLIANKNRVVTYREFYQHVWGKHTSTMDSLRMHIAGVRRKTYYDLIQNQSGLGYKLHTEEIQKSDEVNNNEEIAKS